MSSTGLTTTAAVLSRSSGTVPAKIGCRTHAMYRTPAEIRAIPNEQWERWLRQRSVPWTQFAATPDCQRTLKYVVKAARGRIKAKNRWDSRGRS